MGYAAVTVRQSYYEDGATVMPKHGCGAQTNSDFSMRSIWNE